MPAPYESRAGSWFLNEETGELTPNIPAPVVPESPPADQSVNAGPAPAQEQTE